MSKDDEDDYPDGCFGAGGWGPGGGGSYPRYMKDEAEYARKFFRAGCKRRYYSIVRAWKAFDTDANGRLSIFEWMRACSDMEVAAGARNLWDAFDLDRSGYISLDELDPDGAKVLGDLAQQIANTLGTLDKAWEHAFNEKGYSYRIPFEAFKKGCEMIGYHESRVKAAFFFLTTDRASAGMSRTEYDFLNMWFENGPMMVRSSLSPEAEAEALARFGDTKDKGHLYPKKVRIGDASNEFKTLLLKSYGNFARAWRDGLDFDHSGELDYKEFQIACKNIGYAGSRQALWKELDANGNGTVSLNEICEYTADLLQSLHEKAVREYGSWETAWEEIFDTKGDNRVSLRGFCDGCDALGWKGKAEKVFDLLDMDRCKYLTLESTAWVGGTEEQRPKQAAVMVGDQVLTGAYRKATRIHEIREKIIHREHRFRLEKFDRRARAEIPGSSAFAMTSPSGKSFDAGLGMSRSFSGSGLAMSGSLTMKSQLTGATPPMTGRPEYSAVQMAKMAMRLATPDAERKRSNQESRHGDSAVGLDLSLLSHTGASKKRQDAKDHELPRHLHEDPLSPKMPASQGRWDASEPVSPMSPKSNAGEPLSPTPLSPMWSPGRGGWNGHKARIMDPAWGGAHDSPLKAAYAGKQIHKKGHQGSPSASTTAPTGSMFSASPNTSFCAEPSFMSESMSSFYSKAEADQASRQRLSRDQGLSRSPISVSAPSLSRWRALAQTGMH